MDFKNINNYLNFNTNSNFNNTNYNKDLSDKPKLVASGTKYFFHNILKECHIIKQRNYNLFYNISMFLIFCGILGVILFIKYKGSRTKQEEYQKNLKEKQYIMSKLVYYNRQNLENNQRIKNNMITNLPDYSNHPEASILHRKIYF